MQMRLAVCCLILIATTQSNNLKGFHIDQEGSEFLYSILDTPHISQLLLGERGAAEIILNVTYDKIQNGVDLHIFGEKFTNDEDELVVDPEVTVGLMNSGIGRVLPEIGFRVHEDHGLYGHQSHAAMALYKLGMVSDKHHNEKRSLFFQSSDDVENAMEQFPADVKEACGHLKKGCGKDLQYENEPGYETPKCPTGSWKFTLENIEKGCWGMCGPSCVCWKHICGDCCGHPGCYKHDTYCDVDSESKDCLTLRGVLWDKGPTTC